jgi:hypothetical protein
VNQVVTIKIAEGGFTFDIRKQEFQQLLCSRVLEIRPVPQFACWSTIQLQIDSVHERQVERTRN